MKKRELKQRIEELEARVSELETLLQAAHAQIEILRGYQPYIQPITIPSKKWEYDYSGWEPYGRYIITSQGFSWVPDHIASDGLHHT